MFEYCPAGVHLCKWWLRKQTKCIDTISSDVTRCTVMQLYHARALAGTDSQNCFGRGTLELDSSRWKRCWSHWWERLLPRPTRVLGSVVSSPSGVWGGAPQMIFGHYIRNFVRFHARFSAFGNLTGKANKTYQIWPLPHRPLVWRRHVPRAPRESAPACWH